MEIDWQRLAALIKQDRGDTPQGEYGRRVGGLSQGQVSDLETAKMRRPTARVLDALRKHFGALPEAPALPAEDTAVPASVRGLLELLHPDAALDPLAGLPRGYRERYEQRVRDVEQRLAATAAGLQRELEVYRQQLIDEARHPKKR